jgi:hypothetical protein
MQIDLKALRSMWRQTVWGTAIAMVGIAALAVYFWTQPTPDPAAAKFALQLLVLMPVLLGVAYLIRRFIESLPD